MHPQRVIATLVLGVSALGLSACGTSTQHGRHQPSRQLVEGRKIFSADCGGCHTLTGHDTQAPGGDLGVAHLTAAQVASFARIMPVHPSLSRASILAVAAYVARMEKGHAH